jgi:predicted DNA-binding antitoxin AbrB/MazE fold protein
MTVHGHIENGVIVLDQQVSFPEGAKVEVRILSPLATQSATDTPDSEIPTLAERLKDFIGILELPEDAAINHDHYLYGTPKK